MLVKIIQSKAQNANVTDKDINTEGRTPIDLDLCIERHFSSFHSRESSRMSDRNRLLHLTGHLEDRLGQAADVAAGDAGHGNTAVLGGVDGVLCELVCVCYGWGRK